MYKLIAIDLDGTLLNSYGEVSEENKKVIQKALQKDIEIVIASGRPLASAKSYANEIGAKNYVICGNGSILYDLNQEKIVYDQSIERQKALEIIKICEDNSIFFNIYTDSLTVCKSINYNISFYNNENKKVTEDKKTNIKIVDDIYKYVEENKNIQVLKITVCDESKVIFDRIIKKLKEVKNVDILELQHMAKKYIQFGTEEKKVEYYYTEITSKNVNKWRAIQRLTEILGIEEKQIMAIGDNMNDKDMIENAGMGIIMGNSAPYMKEFADNIVSDNNNNGVAEAIEKYVLNG